MDPTFLRLTDEPPLTDVRAVPDAAARGIMSKASGQVNAERTAAVSPERFVPIGVTVSGRAT